LAAFPRNRLGRDAVVGVVIGSATRTIPAGVEATRTL
jgi:hypothetical protein